MNEYEKPTNGISATADPMLTPRAEGADDRAAPTTELSTPQTLDNTNPNHEVSASDDGYDSEKEWEALHERLHTLRTGPADAAKTLHLAQDRIAWLERKVRRLTQLKDGVSRSSNEDLNGTKQQSEESKKPEDVSGLTEPSEDEEEDQVATQETIPEVRYVNWFAFKNSKIDEKQPAIEVLLGRPRYYYETREHHTIDGRIRSPWSEPGDVAATISVEETEDDLGTRHVPERIRINSPLILSIFSAIDVGNWSTDEPIVLQRPYKFLVYYESKLRDIVKELAGKWGGEAQEPQVTAEADKIMLNTIDGNHAAQSRQDVEEHSATAAVSTNTSDESEIRTSTDSKSSTDNVATYLAMRCLMQFYDKDVKPVVDAFRARTCRQVRFSNLWYLFQPGDIIYQPIDKTGGDVLQAPAGERPVGKTPLAITPKASSAQDAVVRRFLTFYRHTFSLWGRPVLQPGKDDPKNLPPHQRITTFRAYGYHIDYTGTKFGTVLHSCEIRPFDGARAIIDLPCHPLEFRNDKTALLEAAISRGKRFMDFRKPMHCLYSGPTLDALPDGTDTGDEDSDAAAPVRYDHVDGPVIVDFKECLSGRPWIYSMSHPDKYDITSYESREEKEDTRLAKNLWDSADRNSAKRRLSDNIQADSVIEARRRKDFTMTEPFLSAYILREDDRTIETLSDLEFAILPNRAFAFYLRNREWVQIQMDSNKLQHLSSVTDGFNKLKLRKGHKDMVKSLVRNHFEVKRIRSLSTTPFHEEPDIVRGRGNGLVILLHGAPGTGKTSTAECVAELTGKPLLTITCGDLGLTAEDVEESLQLRFHQAQLWDCVLLIDEADVFLAARNRTDLQRNAIVAVFLRVLEYYSGILFLTTNRVGAFDEAFKSRIHMSLYYPPLGEQQTLAIWEMNIDRLETRLDKRLSVDRGAILSFAKRHFRPGPRDTGSNWNGRQIRNAFQTALALAEYEAEEAHLKAKASMSPSDGEAAVPRPPIRLEVRFFEMVATASREFDNYLEETNRGNAAEIAFNNQERSDHLDFNHVTQQQGQSFDNRQGSAGDYNATRPQQYVASAPTYWPPQRNVVSPQRYPGQSPGAEGVDYGRQSNFSPPPQPQPHGPMGMNINASRSISGNILQQKQSGYSEIPSTPERPSLPLSHDGYSGPQASGGMQQQYGYGEAGQGMRGGYEQQDLSGHRDRGWSGGQSGRPGYRADEDYD